MMEPYSTETSKVLWYKVEIQQAREKEEPAYGAKSSMTR